jgi:hypothetical protein
MSLNLPETYFRNIELKTTKIILHNLHQIWYTHAKKGDAGCVMICSQPTMSFKVITSIALFYPKKFLPARTLFYFKSQCLPTQSHLFIVLAISYWEDLRTGILLDSHWICCSKIQQLNAFSQPNQLLKSLNFDNTQRTEITRENR